MPSGEQTLSPVLRRLVRVVESALGQVIREVEGPELFQAVESVRRLMVTVRDGNDAQADEALQRARDLLRRQGPAGQAALARAYTIYLELVNLCENAYRTHRLRRRWRQPADPDAGTPPPGEAAAADAATGSETGARIIWVLTAHPTESRSPANIALLRRLQNLCVDGLEENREPAAAELKHLLHLAWRCGTHPLHKPTVEDEARHLFSLVGDDILDALIDLYREDHQIRLRTWVGGDKDGHPGVGADEAAASLGLSRRRLLDYVGNRLAPRIDRDVALLPGDDLDRAWSALRDALESLRQVRPGDGGRMQNLIAAAHEMDACYRRHRGSGHPAVDRLGVLLRLFPGLVVPLEFREARGCFQPDAPIAAMLERIRDVAAGGEIAWYMQGLVVSMTDAARDLQEAHDLMRDVLGPVPVPVIPLFEMPDVLPRAAGILDEFLAGAGVREQPWVGSDLEVMLGYSDTSKRMGVMSSRLAIHDAMQDLGRWAGERNMPLTFFHGSGGSVGRGGGTVEEQFATWPAGAGHVVKQTLQGEMVERTLATPEILRGQALKIAANQARPPSRQAPGAVSRLLAAAERQAFEEVVGTGEFRTLLARATPYTRLGALHIGSRPTRRSSEAGAGLEELRAIPWVLCWTQTRYLLHAWLGAGAAWRALQQQEAGAGRALPAAARNDPFLRSYLRLLGFTLAKTAPRIWRQYVERFAPRQTAVVEHLAREWEDASRLARGASESEALLHDRAWLRESIHYRAPMIHPLNLLQIEALAREEPDPEDEMLFRETVTGIAAGMLTTG